MSEMDKLALALQQHQNTTDQRAESVKQEIGAYRAAVAELIKDIERWINPLVQQRLLSAKVVEKRVTESPAGLGQQVYEADHLTIDVAGATVQLTPAGCYFIGCHGIVKITGLKKIGEALLVRTVKDGNSSWQLKKKRGNNKSDLEPFDEDAFGRLLQGTL